GKMSPRELREQLAGLPERLRGPVVVLLSRASPSEPVMRLRIVRMLVDNRIVKLFRLLPVDRNQEALTQPELSRKVIGVQAQRVAERRHRLVAFRLVHLGQSQEIGPAERR